MEQYRWEQIFILEYELIMRESSQKSILEGYRQTKKGLRILKAYNFPRRNYKNRRAFGMGDKKGIILNYRELRVRRL